MRKLVQDMEIEIGLLKKIQTDTGNEKNSTSQIKTSVEGLANGIQKQRLRDRS